MDLCYIEHGKNGSWVIQNSPGFLDILYGGHLVSLYLLLRSKGLIFAMLIEAGKNGLVLHKAWQKWVTGDPKYTRVARYSL